MDYFLSLDTKTFLLINHLPHNLIFDSFFGLLTLAGSEGLIWLVIAFYLFFTKKLKRKDGLILLFTFSLVLIVERFTKGFFNRQRPGLVVPDAIVLFSSFSGGSSFPSGHSMMAFALSCVLGTLGKLGKAEKWCLYILAVLIALSRIYLGQHYPFDVLAGAFLGVLIGLVSLRAASYFNQKF